MKNILAKVAVLINMIMFFIAGLIFYIKSGWVWGYNWIDYSLQGNICYILAAMLFITLILLREKKE